MWNKNNWQEVTLNDIAKTSKVFCSPKQDGIERFVAGEHMKSNELKIKDWGFCKDEILGPAFHVKFKPNQILYGSRRTYLKKIAIADFVGVCANTTFVIDANTKKTDVLFLAFIMQSDRFTNHSIVNSKGSTNPFINWKDLAKYKLLLPPRNDQQDILSLFQSIETAIEKVEEQEKNLRNLWLNLTNGLVNEKPTFGNLLTRNKLVCVRYCDVVQKIMRKIDPLSYGIERIVAGENLESEDFKIRTWQKVGECYLGPAFHVLFKPGDILYGSRRTYLKKVGYPDFEGVCANTTYVIRAKEEILLQDLLKHIMLSERFTQYSIGVSKGSTNPYINWKDLDEFTFFIPDLDTQSRIVRILDDIIALIELCKEQKQNLKVLKQKLLNEILG